MVSTYPQANWSHTHAGNTIANTSPGHTCSPGRIILCIPKPQVYLTSCACPTSYKPTCPRATHAAQAAQIYIVCIPRLHSVPRSWMYIHAACVSPGHARLWISGPYTASYNHTHAQAIYLVVVVYIPRPYTCTIIHISRPSAMYVRNRLVIIITLKSGFRNLAHAKEGDSTSRTPFLELLLDNSTSRASLLRTIPGNL